ncbi:hypothetical protein GCM10022219_05710 [Microbacterium oryzae]|uniref:Uncharacterized protein n=1 Tax=Microbacterium oryzae TaxID=743009 RepID=A0A6I6E5U6_9MICO|nr:hypothetical protein [Microbacterium oryzae]QGU26688.1 hypothetical protein D7D94_02640 [Microbacterium oryzae]
MSTSDGRPLTRRQLRELRQTGQHPIIPAEDVAASAEEDDESEHEVVAPDAPERDDEVSELVESEADEPAAASEEPTGEVVEDPVAAETTDPHSADPGHPRLTRRQLREQERLRTDALATIPAVDGDDDEPIEATIVTDEVPQAAEPIEAQDAPEAPVEAEESPALVREAEAPRATLRPGFGENIAIDEVTHSPASFDELLTHPHETSGSASAPSTLILDEIPATAALSAPITATGELLITSSHKLPEGFGSSGAARGTTDGREVDAVLLDGELPLSSSPTPIAASSAVSTSKSPGEVIRPPVPEKNQKLVLTLGITAAGLGIVVVGAVVIAWTTGVFG